MSKVVSLEQANAMLSADGPILVSNVVEHERLQLLFNLLGSL